VDLVNEGWAREAGTPLFKDGVIDDSDIGIEVGGGYAAGAFETMTVNSPTSSGMVITGSTFASVDGLTVTNGDYCVRTALTAAGRFDLDNLNCQNQLVAGVSYQRDISGSFSGSITGSVGAAVEYGSATTADHDFTGLMLSGNSIGMSMGGKGTFTLTGSNFGNSNYDISVPGSSEVTFIDGTIDDNKTSVTGSGVIKRARSLTITLSEDTGGTVDTVEGATILLMAGDSSIQGTSTTDASGVAGGILYNTMERTSAGATWPNLGGYSAVTVAMIDYQRTGANQKMDFRYTSEAVDLDPDAPSVDTILLEEADIIPYRVCYSFASTAYNMLASCSGMATGGSKSYDNDGDGTNDAWEYGYFGATPKDMSGKTVLMDVPFMYIGSDSSSSTKNNWNNTNLIISSNYDFYGYQRWTATSPYNSHLYMDNMNAVSLTTTAAGVDAGVMFGYFAWSDINVWITNSTVVGFSGAASARENSNWDPDHFVFADNTVIRAGGPGTPKTSFGYQEMCIVNSGIHDAIVTNNIISGCPISIMIRNIVYTASFQFSNWGPDDMIIEGNTFLNTGTISTWFYFSYADDVIVKDNTFAGNTAPTYQVYVQSPYTVGLVVDGNTFTSGDQPIYIRGGLDYNIKNNDITGNRNQAHPGIYTLNGYGSISGNTLTDADGGIMIDGVRSGQSLTVTDNTIGTSAGRTAPGAVGIWAEDCGATTLVTGGNDVTTVMNGLIIDGCAVSDTGSKFTGTGGVGGASWSVDVMESYYAPGSLNISEGDSVRWRAKEYFNGTPYIHTVTSDANSTEVFDSGTMNLGSTFAYTFDNAGTYYYHCTNHLSMTGSITVTAGGSSSFTANGINVISSGNKVISLNGTEVGGYSTGVSKYGGSH
jgi:plastocyanin